MGDVVYQWSQINSNALLRAINDLESTWPGKYDGTATRTLIDEYARRRAEIADGLKRRQPEALKEAERFVAAFRAALLANPLLDGDRLLVLRRYLPADRVRNAFASDVGFRQLNSHSTADTRKNWLNEIAVLDHLRTAPRLTRLYRPATGTIVRDIDLDFGADRLLFSGIDAQQRWAVFQMSADGTGLVQLTPTNQPKIDFFDACYLPDGRIITASTAAIQGLPCQSGNGAIALLYLLDPSKGALRQLTFDQDSDWSPSVANDGRVLYTRWEYSDLPHYFSRILFTMNPDGTTQLANYGSGSYFPTALLHVRAIPGEPHKLVGIVGGHHDRGEAGRLTLLDPSLSKKYPFRYHPTSKEWGPPKSPLRIMTEVLPAAQTGFLQEIPGWGKDVVGDVCDGQTANQYALGKPYFIHPWPLGTSPLDGAGKYFLVSAKPDRQPWGIYLADVFDNLTLVAETSDSALLEPIPLQPRLRPAAIPDRVRPDLKTATVHIADIYNGPGLDGIPRGTVKAIRVFSYHFCYFGTGGHDKVGVESSWDVKRILGTVPVETDGSAHFEIPANTPIALQPLDAQGRALQLMRSWLVGMPGERVSCTGCHENNLTSVPSGRTQADLKGPRPLEPFHGPPHPFTFEIDVFPVIQRYCLGCHDGATRPALRGTPPPPVFTTARATYDALHPFVRRPGPESELEMFYPMEYHASTSPLVRLLEKGHHGVTLDGDAWGRLAAWIDLNAPYRGSWDSGYWKLRKALAELFAGRAESPEEEHRAALSAYQQAPKPAPVAPTPEAPVRPDDLTAPGVPMSAATAAARQRALGETRRTLTLPGGGSLEFVRIPAGTFVMGAQNGAPDERPRAIVGIDRPFWMSVHEIRNRDYHLFDPRHDTRYVDQHGKDHNFPGYIANHDDQPVARVSWQEARAFCRWLSEQAKVHADLPTEAQWEWAARAGTTNRFFFGGLGDDFSKWANLADRSVRWHVVSYNGGSTIQQRLPYPPSMNFPLHEERFEDKWFVVDYVGQYEPNPWGLKDIIGNVSEWTRSSYRPYPYRDDDGRNDGDAAERKVARGGSWDARPVDAGASIRLAYESYQKVHDVGFRVILEDVP